jgi:RNA polymerase sigma factor (sigma-70 family)
MTGDAHAAEDVAQATFLALARRAPQLKDRSILSGWLHRTARNLAAKTVRADVRRRAREQQVAVMNEANPIPPANVWEDIAPLLDSALGALNETDRDAVLLRFFQRKTDQEIGLLIGLSEAAAQKRVSRAVERLRKLFAKQHVAGSAAGLAVAVSINGIQAAPAGLASAISAAAALAGKGTAVSHLVQITMSTIRAKHFASALMAALLVSTVYLSYRNASLHHQLETLRASAAPLTSANESTPRGDQHAMTAQERRRLRMEHLELLSMRGRVAQLSRELRERAIREAPRQTAQSNEPGAEDSILFSASTTNRVPLGSVVVVGGWRHGEVRGYLLLTPTIARGDTIPEDERLQVKSLVVAAPENFWFQIGWGDAKSDSRRSTLSGLLTSAQTDSLLQTLKETKGAEISNESVAKGGDGERLGIGFSTEDDHASGALMGVDVYPRISSDAQCVDLEVRPSVVPANAHIHPSLSRAPDPNQSH